MNKSMQENTKSTHFPEGIGLWGEIPKYKIINKTEFPMKNDKLSKFVSNLAGVNR